MMRKVVIVSILVYAITGCIDNSYRPSNQRLRAIKCAKNWKASGFNFDPNSMTCLQMYEKIEAIRKAEFWAEKGYVFDPNSMTCNQMDQKVKDIDRAAYWKERGYEFDPNSMTIYEMDRKAIELDEANWWKDIGYYYDPNSKTVFLDESKKTKLSSLASIHSRGNTWEGSIYSYPTLPWPKNYSYQIDEHFGYHLPPVEENGSYYGQVSEDTGRPKTVHVRGYYRKDGTYVRSHYRSSPRK